MAFRKSFKRPRFKSYSGGSIVRKKVRVLGFRVPMLLLAAVAAFLFIPAVKSKVMGLIQKK